MGLNETPSGERVHIGFFGVRNAGKSSLVNAVCGQDLAVVSDTPGTTTDPVRKAMELLPIGPVVIVDTPGIDDEGELGVERVRRAKRALRSCDLAVLVVDATAGLSHVYRDMAADLERREAPVVIAWNKVDLLADDEVPCGYVSGSESGSEEVRSYSELTRRRRLNRPANWDNGTRESLSTGQPGFPKSEPLPNQILVSAKTGEGVHQLKELLGKLAGTAKPAKRLVADLLDEGDAVVLVAPIDESAPKGRIILPQQMVLRDVLDAHAAALVCQPEELAGVLSALKEPPHMVITDSQAFGAVARIVPDDVWLTSFSILMARYKGDLETLVKGAVRLASLSDSDRVLVSEGCTHHRQCEDIGTVKIPRWIEEYSGARPQFDFTSGGGFPNDLESYALVVHCGGCMLNDREMAHRISAAQAAGVPIVNYGMAIAQMHGILERSLQPISYVNKDI